MQKTTIKKKNKKEWRTIYIPNEKEKEELRKLLPFLNEELEKQIKIKQITDNTVQGFRPGKSPVTNALEHKNLQWTWSLDLKDFFDSVTKKHVVFLDEDVLNKVFIDGHPRQGLPTSPVVCNLAALGMDAAILKIVYSFPYIVYTRYADDLNFSFNDLSYLDDLKSNVFKVVEAHLFEVNDKKVRLQSATFGKRKITGVSVDNSISISRKFKRKMRATRHQKNWESFRGQSEWKKLKLPNLK